MKALNGLKRFSAALALAALCTAPALFAQELTGYDIAKKADELPDGKTSSYTATMTLLNKKGATRVRQVIMRSKDFGDTDKTVLAFTQPKDVAGVSYLMFDYDDANKDTDSWLYMPAMKKVRRISGSSKGDDFMGTDFTYEDMEGTDLEKYSYNLLGEENVGSEPCWKVECIAKDKDKKTPRRIVWFSKNSYVTYKAELYDRQDKLQRTLTCSNIRQIDGYWTTGKMVMENVQTGHSTTLEMTNISYDQPLADNLFTVAALEKGTIK